MNRRIGNTSLIVIGVLYQKSQTSIIREERCEAVTLMKIKNEKTGETGHLYHELCTDKRDIEHEESWTDTPSLFADDHPEGYELQELSSCGPVAMTPTEETDEILATIIACHDGSYLDYRAGNPDGETYDEQKWGMYAD